MKNSNDKYIFILCISLSITVPGVVVITSYSADPDVSLIKGMISLFIAVVFTMHIYMKDHKKIPPPSTIMLISIISIIIYWCAFIIMLWYFLGERYASQIMNIVYQDPLAFLLISFYRMIPVIFYFAFILEKHFQYLDLSTTLESTSRLKSDRKVKEIAKETTDYAVEIKKELIGKIEKKKISSVIFKNLIKETIDYAVEIKKELISNIENKRGFGVIFRNLIINIILLILEFFENLIGILTQWIKKR